jgi:hypothetical protein
VYGTGKLATQLARFLALFVGPKWGDFNTSMRIVAGYWIFGISLYYALPSADTVGQRAFDYNSLWILAAFHTLIWSNIVTDYVSFNVTREILTTYSTACQSKPGPSAGFTVKLLLCDWAVGALMLIFAIIGSNIAFLFYAKPDVDKILANFYNTVFNLETIFQPFTGTEGSLFDKVEVPALFILAATSYAPTVLAVVGMMVTSLLLFVTHLLLYIGRQHVRLRRLLSYTDKTAWLRACLGGMVTGLTFLGGGIALLK